MLEVKAINSFYGKAHILEDLSFAVGEGEVVSLLGRNGAGKTTTLKSIMQLVTPRSGSVHFQGHNITGRPPHRIARMGLGYVPEERRIFTDLTILENLEVGRQPPRAGLIEWTVDVLFELFPNLKERRGNRGKELSGGEQQMLTIARTLMGNLQLLLLDEPSEGIAPALAKRMSEILGSMKSEGVSILIAESNTAHCADLLDRMYVVERGSVTETAL